MKTKPTLVVFCTAKRTLSAVLPTKRTFTVLRITKRTLNGAKPKSKHTHSVLITTKRTLDGVLTTKRTLDDDVGGVVVSVETTIRRWRWRGDDGVGGHGDDDVMMEMKVVLVGVAAIEWGWKHFKTLSLDESRSPDFDLFSYQEEYSEEEVAETMAKTMEQYMSKTRADYGSGVVRPKIEDKDNFELKGQFLKELRTNTFSRSDHEDANEHIEKVLKIVDLFHIFNITIDQVMLRSFPMSLTGAASRWLRNKPSGLITTWEYLKTKFLNKYWAPPPTARTCKEMEGRSTQLSRQILDLRGAIPSKIAADAKVAIQEMHERRQSMEDTLIKFMSESAKIHEENSNLIKEIRTSMDAAIRNQGASIKTLEIQIGQMSKSISTFVEADLYPIRRTGSSQYAVSTEQNRTLMYETKQTTIPFPSHLNGYYCEEKRESYGPQFPKAYFQASHIYNYIPRKEKDLGSFTLPCFINNICFDNALADLGASISVMPLLTYLNLGLGKLAHTKLTVELADRTVKYPKRIAKNVLVGEVIKEFRARNDDRMVSKVFGYPCDCDYDKKICMDCAYNLKFSCMIDFAVLEDMNAYRDEDMGDVIFGEPFLREVRINARRFDRMITIYNGNDEVTY
ncbi:hypothetical protein Tco_0675217 [Tanacetum coccineum]